MHLNHAPQTSAAPGGVLGVVMHCGKRSPFVALALLPRVIAGK